jgi:hypothetical protein
MFSDACPCVPYLSAGAARRIEGQQALADEAANGTAAMQSTGITSGVQLSDIFTHALCR